MAKRPSRRKERELKKQAIRKTKLRLGLALTLLFAPMTILIFRLGQAFWPTWLTDYRKLIIGILLVAVIFLALMSPVIIEESSNPRALSGPGKNPETGWGG